MNRTILIVNLLVSSMSIARPIDETTASTADENYTIDDPSPRIVDETEYDVTPLARKDDVINTSDLSKIYASEENQFAKTRSLKDETENVGFRKADLKQESRRMANLKSGEKLADNSQAKSDYNEKQEEIETKATKREESKSTERTVPVAKVQEKFKADKKEEKNGSNAEVVEETKSGKKQQSKVEERSGSLADLVEETKSGKKQQREVEERHDTTASTDVESKDAMKEESRRAQDSSEIIGLERTTETLRREVKSVDYLEDDDSDKDASDESSERMGYEVPVNDESNSAWDALDDIPMSRRMFSLPANLNIELETKSGSENVDPVEARTTPEIKIAPRNHITYGLPNPVISIPQLRNTFSVPHIHPAILPGRRFIVPGFVKIRHVLPNTPINDIRRLLSQETNNIISTQHVPDYRYESDNVRNQNQNVVVDSDESSQTPPTFKDVSEDYNSKEESNAYPYTPPNEDSKTVKMPQTSTANPLFAKLVEASEHPQRFNPNINRNNVQNIQNAPFNNYMRPNYNYPKNFNSENMQNYPGAPYTKYVAPNTAAPQSYYKYIPGFGRSR